MEHQTSDALGNAFDKDCVLRLMDVSLSAALPHPVPGAARPPERTPGPGRVREIYDEVARSLRAAEEPLQPEARPFPGIVLD
eukprot:10037500-Alexandrium_andersonii.AAC.1